MRQRSQGVGGTCGRDHPQSVQQPRAILQSRHSRDSSLCTREPLACGGRESGRTHRSAPTRSSECPATPGGAGQSPPPTERRGIRRGIGQRTPNAGSRSAGPSSPSSSARQNARNDRRHQSLHLPSPVPTSPVSAQRSAHALRPPQGPNLLSLVIPGWFPKEGPQPFLWSFQGGSGREIEIPPRIFLGDCQAGLRPLAALPARRGRGA